MPEKQAWESLRQRVDDQQNEADTGARRIEHLERRVNTLEVSLARQLEALTVAYQHMAKSIDQLVTRNEFKPLQMTVQLLCALVIVGVLVYIFKGSK